MLRSTRAATWCKTHGPTSSPTSGTISAACEYILGRPPSNRYANAFTFGHNILFGPSRYAPATHVGRRLLAHELTHVVQQEAGGEQRIQRQPAEHGLPVRIKIGDATRLRKEYAYHFDSKIPEKLKQQLSKQIKVAFSFLPKQFPVAVDWGQFKAADLKPAGNIQVWLIPDSDSDLAREILSLYGYAEELKLAAIRDLGGVKNEADKDNPTRTVPGLTPIPTAELAKDPLTARPVMVKVPDEFWAELDPAPEFVKAHPKAIASRRVAQLGDTVLHELGHNLRVEHAEGNTGADSRVRGRHERTFPPDMMDEVAPVLAKEFSNAPNIQLTKPELDALGGEQTVRKNPIVEKVDVDPKRPWVNVWIDPLRLNYSKAQQNIILSNLQLLVLFVDSMKAAKKKTNK